MEFYKRQTKIKSEISFSFAGLPFRSSILRRREGTLFNLLFTRTISWFRIDQHSVFLYHLKEKEVECLPTAGSPLLGASSWVQFVGKQQAQILAVIFPLAHFIKSFLLVFYMAPSATCTHHSLGFKVFICNLQT